MLMDYAPRYQSLDVSISKETVIKVHLCGRPLIRQGLTQVFKGTEFSLSCENSYGPTDISGCRYPMNELFIIDDKFCAPDIIGLIKDLKEANPKTRLMLLTDHTDADTLLTARKEGVDGVCLSSSAPEVLVRSMQLVMLGEVVVSAELILAMMAIPLSKPGELAESNSVGDVDFSTSEKNLLSNRETQVLNWLKEGAPNKVIARKLNVAEATVKVHVKSILKKIGAGNRAQAAIWAAHNMDLKPAEL